MADYLPLFIPGQAHTRTTSAAVVGGNLLIITGTGTVAVSAAATHLWTGVAAFDAASGARVTVHSGGIQRLVAVGAITAGDNVEAAAGGGVATHANGAGDVNIVGLALTSAINGALVEVQLAR